MFWADKLLEGRSGDEVVNDAWTPSGMVHMGSIRGRGPVMCNHNYESRKRI